MLIYVKTTFLITLNNNIMNNTIIENILMPKSVGQLEIMLSDLNRCQRQKLSTPTSKILNIIAEIAENILNEKNRIK